MLSLQDNAHNAYRLLPKYIYNYTSYSSDQVAQDFVQHVTGIYCLLYIAAFNRPFRPFAGFVGDA